MDKSKMENIRWFKRCIDATAEPREKTMVKKEVAERMGIALPTLHARLQGKGEFKTIELQQAAEYFGKEPPTKEKRESALNNVVHFRQAPPVDANGSVAYPVLGDLRDRHWIEVDMLSQAEPRVVYADRSTRYPNATPMAWVAHDDSMNTAYPYPILDGMIILGVDFQEAGGVFANNMIVVVERRRGGTIERSVKTVAVLPDRIELQPRSTNPIHRPIIYKNGNLDDGVEVKVLTVVHRAYGDM